MSERQVNVFVPDMVATAIREMAKIEGLDTIATISMLIQKKLSELGYISDEQLTVPLIADSDGDILLKHDSIQLLEQIMKQIYEMPVSHPKSDRRHLFLQYIYRLLFAIQRKIDAYPDCVIPDELVDLNDL